jgi:transcriptional regulator with XRE-family HTH domain
MVAELARPYPAMDMVRLKAYNISPTVPGSFGDWIRQLRDAELWSQEEFAARVNDGMTAADVSQLERGKVALPKPPRMIALARALRRPVVELYVAAGYPEFCEGIANWALCVNDNVSRLDANASANRMSARLADLLTNVDDAGDRHAIEVYARFVGGEDATRRILTTDEERRIRNYVQHVRSRGTRPNSTNDEHVTRRTPRHPHETDATS